MSERGSYESSRHRLGDFAGLMGAYVRRYAKWWAIVGICGVTAVGAMFWLVNEVNPSYRSELLDYFDAVKDDDGARVLGHLCREARARIGPVNVMAAIGDEQERVGLPIEISPRRGSHEEAVFDLTTDRDTSLFRLEVRWESDSPKMCPVDNHLLGEAGKS